MRIASTSHRPGASAVEIDGPMYGRCSIGSEAGLSPGSSWCGCILCAVCLAALVGPANSYASESMQQDALRDISCLRFDVGLFVLEHGRPPARDEDLQVVMNGARELCTTDAPSRPAAAKRSGSGWPCDRSFGPPVDPWGNPYVYIPIQDPDGLGAYEIHSCGPDGISRTSGHDPGDLNGRRGALCAISSEGSDARAAEARTAMTICAVRYT